MSDSSPSELQRLLAHEFERRGWHYDLTIGRTLVEEIERRGEIDSQALAQQVPVTYLDRNHAQRRDIAEAIESAIGGRRPVADAGTTTLVINDNRYSLSLGAGAQITGSNVNVGGAQINVQGNASKDEVLAAAAALVRSGLAGHWNSEAATELARVIDTRDDITFSDIEELTREVADVEQADSHRVRGLLSAIATNAVGGALGTGMAAGLGQVLAHLPNLPI